MIKKDPVQTATKPKRMRRPKGPMPNETCWCDWSCLEQHREIYRFTRGMIALRRSHPILSKEQFYTDDEIHWFGPQGKLPNWDDPKKNSLPA